MQTLQEFAQVLTHAQKQQRVTANALAHQTGLSPQSVRQILAGVTAPRLTNAMALAAELGLELVLLPRSAARSLSEAAQSDRTVLTDVERRAGVQAPPIKGAHK